MSIGSSRLLVPNSSSVGLSAGPAQYMSFAVGSGVTTLIPGVPGKQIVLMSYGLDSTSQEVTVNFQSNVTTSLSTAKYSIGGSSTAPDILDRGYSPVGHFATAVGEALDINVGSGGTVVGDIVFVAV